MRLWDYRLLKVLPDRFIVSQWRECIAIKRQWEKGTLKHRLVSYVMDYDGIYFATYVTELIMELNFRKINTKYKYFDEILQFCRDNGEIGYGNFYYPEHNDRYLKQCYYNLQEKYDRGIITKEEWQKIEDLVGNEIESVIECNLKIEDLIGKEA